MSYHLMPDFPENVFKEKRRLCKKAAYNIRKSYVFSRLKEDVRASNPSLNNVCQISVAFEYGRPLQDYNKVSAAYVVDITKEMETYGLVLSSLHSHDKNGNLFIRIVFLANRNSLIDFYDNLSRMSQGLYKTRVLNLRILLGEKYE